MDDQTIPPSHDWREDSPLFGTVAYIFECIIQSVKETEPIDWALALSGLAAMWLWAVIV